MADSKISALSDGTTPAGSDQFVVARSGGNNYLTWTEILAAVKAVTVDLFAAPAANVAFNAKKITGLANGTAATDAAAYGQTVKGGGLTGTSMPGSPATNDLFFRSDLGLLFYYDGTRWLSVNEYRKPITPAPIATTTVAAAVAFARLHPTLDSYVTSVDFSTFQVTGDGSNFYTITAQKITPANAATSLGSFTTAADTAATFTNHSLAVNAALTAAGFPLIRLDTAKTGAPGSLYCYGDVALRLIGT